MLLAVLLGSLLPRPAMPAQRANPVDSPQKWTWVTVADHLNHPWGLAFLPEGGFLVTERSGALRRITAVGRSCRR